MDSAVTWLSRRWVAIALDVLVVSAVYLGALLLRFEGAVPDSFISRFTAFLPFVGATYVVVSLLSHAYSPDASLVRVGVAALGSGLLIIVSGIFADRPAPLSVLALGALGSVVGLVGVRALGRLPH